MRPMMILSVIMTAVYLLLAAYIFFNGKSFSAIDPAMTKVFASIVLMYGLFRGWKTYETYFKR